MGIGIQTELTRVEIEHLVKGLFFDVSTLSSLARAAPSALIEHYIMIS